jgi:threonine/homoserine/homoserine lactone efflux protein
MEALFNGIVTGLLLSIFVGATFFMLIETSMTRGFKAALWFDAGVVLCDALIITAVYFFASWINNTIVKNEYFSVACGLIFMLFGANYIFSRNRNKDAVMANRNIRLMLNGFVINFMNPAVVLFWLGTMAFTITKFKYTGKETIAYYTAALVTMIAFDVIKAYFAYRISNFFNAKVLKGIYLLSGALMIGLGFWLIIQ